VVFHTGRIEGSIRRPPPSDPLLPDAWRRNLNERHEHAGRFLPVGEDRREEQWLLARFAFEAATERCVVSWALRERTGTEIRNPSGLILDLVARRAGGPLEAYGPAFDDVVPRDEGAEARRFPADATDHDLALFAAGPPPTEDDLSRLLDEPRARHLAPALLAGQARWRGTTLGPHDGVLRDERALHRVEELLRGRSWSATALEALANCPFSYLVRLLKLDNDRPEQDDYDPMERGKLFHTLLERIYSGLVADGRVPLSPELLADAIASLDRLVAEEARGLDRESPRRRLQRGATLRSLRDDAAILLAREAHRPPALRTTPVRVEMAFGFDEDDPSRTPTLPSAGGGIALRGKIDRVDRRPDGALEVVDFKTGKSRAKSHELRATIDGKTEVRLQLPVYLEAARQGLGVDPARAYYSHATTDRGFDEVEITAADRDRILPEVIALVGHLLERARSGWFPCTPGRACCRREFAAACGPGVVARFQRKRHDPALEAHLAIVRGPGPEADA
jgi:RecB family exonuclease